ncbi:MAG TPA: phospholipase [Pirellulaceae bacterium]|nr:phospholipase [Pirellulaceae bacterium]
MSLPDLLRRLHRILKQRTDLESRLARGPRVLAVSQGLVKKCEDELSAAKEKAFKTKQAADDRQAQLRQREQRVERLKGMLAEAKNNKEYQNLQEQIAADVQANAVLADEAFELLEALDVCNSQIGDAQGRLEVARKDFSTIQDRIDAEKLVLEQEMARVLAELAEAEEEFPRDLKTDYDRAVKSKGENCLAVVDGQTCGHCYQTLTPQIFNALSMNRTVPCGGCGALLYLPERD